MAVPSFYDYAESLSEQTINVATMTEFATLDWTAPAAGDYLIFVSFALRGTSASYSIMFRSQLDDSIQVMGQTMSAYEPNSITESMEYRTFSAFFLAEGLSSGSHYIDVDAYVENITYITGYIKNIRIVVIRWDDWLTTSGMKGYVVTTAAATISSAVGTPTTLQTLNITPDVSGDYLILGYWELDVNSTLYSAYITLNVNDSEDLPIDSGYCSTAYNFLGFEGNDSTDVIPMMAGGIVNLTSGGSRSIVMEGYRSSTSVTPQVWRRSLLAIRLGALTDANHDEDTTEDSFTNTSFSTSNYKGNLSFTPSAQGYYFIIALTAHFDIAITYSSCVRLEQTAGTGTGTIAQENKLPKQVGTTLQDSYGFSVMLIKELMTTTQTFYNEMCLTNTGTGYVRMGLIIAFQLEETGAGPEAADENIKKFNENLDSGMINNGLN